MASAAHYMQSCGRMKGTTNASHTPTCVHADTTHTTETLLVHIPCIAAHQCNSLNLMRHPAAGPASHQIVCDAQGQ